MANEAADGFTFLYSLFSGDATLSGLATGGIYRDVAPDGTVPPWLVFGHQSGQDVTSATAVRILAPNLYRVFAVGPESGYATIKAMADRVDALLQPGGQPLRFTTQGGVSILAAYREQPLALPEMVAGSSYGAAWLNLGGLYRLLFAAQ